MVFTKPSIKGLETPSRCLTSQGPRVAGTRAAFLALSVMASCSWVLRLGSTLSRKEMGKGVAFVDVGEVAVEACFGVFVCEESGVGEFPAEDWETRVRMFEK